MWGALPTQLLQAAGGLPSMVPIIDAAINNIACSELEPIVYVGNIFAKLQGESGERPTLFEAHNPISEKNQFEDDVNRVVKTCNNACGEDMHEHTQTCYKSNSDYCRMARPQPTIDKTRCVQLIYGPETAEHPEKYIVLPEIELQKEETTANRDLSVNPVPQRDSRILIWEMKREASSLPLLSTTEQEGKKSGTDFLELPADLQAYYDSLTPASKERVNRALKNRNGIVVEYNKIVSALLGCNTDVSFLGSDSQAKLALCYI